MAFYLEGGLDNVTISMTFQDSTINLTTLPNGTFSLTLPQNQMVRIGFSKHSYQAVTLVFDTRGVPEALWSSRPLFSDLELIMRRLGDIPLPLVDQLGRLYYNSSKEHIDFAITSKRDKKKVPEADNAMLLMQRAVDRNKTLASLEVLEEEKQPERPRASKISLERTRIIQVPDTVTITSSFDLSLLGEGASIGEAEIAGRQKAIEQARIRLELDRFQSTTTSDSLLLLYRANQIKAAEMEIESAKSLIELQKSEINSQERSLKFLALSLSLFLILASVAYIFYRDKLRTNTLLKKRNQRIVESLSYAKRIQQAILIPESEIRNHLPKSFVFYRPRDIVSGDFYWFTERKGKLVLAAIDCTGHGVPGVFMSLIGNTLINEIILEKEILNPAQVLELLDEGVRESLHQNGNGVVSQDGMEMSICVIDPKRRKVSYAGAVVPIYVVDKNKIQVLKGSSRSIGGNRPANGSRKKVRFGSHEFQMDLGAEVFMFTDGYMDQFGSPEYTKFNAGRFKKLLCDIQGDSVKKQKKQLEQAFDQWKGETPQTDDTLIMGFKF